MYMASRDLPCLLPGSTVLLAHDVKTAVGLNPRGANFCGYSPPARRRWFAAARLRICSPTAMITKGRDKECEVPKERKGGGDASVLGVAVKSKEDAQAVASHVYCHKMVCGCQAHSS